MSIGIGIGAAGVLLTAFTYGANLHGLTLGATAVVLGACLVAWPLLCCQMRKPGKDVDAAFEHGHQVGYDKGYWEGRRSARPVVVPMRGADVRTPTAVEEVAGHHPAS